MFLDLLDTQRHTKFQRLKQIVFMLSVGSVISMMYVNSNMAFLSTYRGNSFQNFLRSTISSYFFEDQLESRLASLDLEKLPEDLRSDYITTDQRGIIKSLESLPFDTSCLDEVDKISFDEHSEYESKDLKNKKYKKILVWHQAYSGINLGFESGKSGFEKSCCKERRCFITSNRTLMSVTKYDAVIMQFRGLLPNDWPRKRTGRQRWIFYEMESGAYVYEDTSLYKNFFNWTMTFRRDSDIYNRYGQVVLKSLMSSGNVDKVLKNYALGKTKLAAWFVSNCNTLSYRENYVKNLQQYISIDVFGQCGKYNCSRNDSSKCYDMLNEDYKFYLSFENSLCRDYATEKLFRILKYDVVPVVYGFADYEAIAPPHSYINAMSFNTSKDLADYLLYLNNNDTAYNEYLNWKNYFHVFAGQAIKSFNLCELCYKLHNDNVTKVYSDIGKWFGTEAHCKRLYPSSWLEWAFSKANIRLFPG